MCGNSRRVYAVEPTQPPQHVVRNYRRENPQRQREERRSDELVERRLIQLDAAFQALGASVADASARDAYLPFGVESFTAFYWGQQASTAAVRARLGPSSGRPHLLCDHR